MPKSRKYNKRGGFLQNTGLTSNYGGNNVVDTVSKTTNDAGKSISDFFSGTYNKVFGKKEQTNGLTIGGRRKRRRTRRTQKLYGGNFKANTNLNNIASKASPISGIQTAKPCSWTGGKKTKKRRSRSRRRL